MFYLPDRSLSACLCSIVRSSTDKLSRLRRRDMARVWIGRLDCVCVCVCVCLSMYVHVCVRVWVCDLDISINRFYDGNQSLCDKLCNSFSPVARQITTHSCSQLHATATDTQSCLALELPQMYIYICTQLPW